MARILKAYRLQPEYVEVVEKRAKDLIRSEGFIIEQCIYEQFKDELGPTLYPGRKIEKDNDEK